MKRFYLLFFTSLCLLTISQSVISQENPIDSLIRDTNSFIVNDVMESDNTACQSHFIDGLLRYTTLGSLVSESFRLTFDADLMDIQRDPLNFVKKVANPSLTNIQRHAEWLTRKAQYTSQEEIDEMRKDLRDVEAVWGFCLRHPDKIAF